MEYVCDAPDGTTWFRIETEAEAMRESALMGHAVEKHYRQAQERAAASYVPPAGGPWIEQEIGKKAHLRRTMPVFFTLRGPDGTGLATAMLPGGDGGTLCPVIVGPGNRDPYADHAEAIAALGRHVGLRLDRGRCYPYGQRG
ncbi:hypothetical protein [Methylobacterium oryzihabitans]|uniref:Uncharacterized protein n=1 Tax=Methylobacterium oryzihabitans TaxID=2499852 RepID=A0A437NZ57_9HYPH|nr:hypothetical protein [Methylobacterium oryzihabitans]RVU15295.1 hypothetical protein EOE48_19875 [Methylobacterium oryzihabitans]